MCDIFFIRKETIMKCANCGKEFGSGTHCQNCGIDRVAGLANYSGYDSHAGSNGYDSSSYGGQTSPKTTVCYACNEIIPLGATYCPVCGKKLIVTCPNCGHEYSSQYSVCSECGTNRIEYEERKKKEEEEKRAWEQSPEGQAELAEQQRKEMEQENKKITYYFFGVPFYGFISFLFLKEYIDLTSITIIICAVLGFIFSYITYNDII